MAAHGVDVRQRVGGGDGAIEFGIVDEGRDHVDAEDNTALGVEPEDGGVLCVVEASEETLALRNRERVEHLPQRRWAQLRGSTGAVDHVGQAYVCHTSLI